MKPKIIKLPLTGYEKAGVWSKIHILSEKLERASYKQLTQTVSILIDQINDELQLIEAHEEAAIAALGKRVYNNE